MKLFMATAVVSLILFAGINQLIPDGPEPMPAARFIAAQKEGKTIPPVPVREAPEPNSQPSKEDCTAAALFPQEQHQPFTGTVTRVIDGDTLEARVGGTLLKIRLWGVDAPEMGQTNGAWAHSYLEELAPPDSRIAVHPVSMDRYGRVVAVIGKAEDPGGWALNVKVTVFGQAYHVDRFQSESNVCLKEAEKAARSMGAGVWKHGGGVRPWEYRKQQGNPNGKEL